MKAATSSSQRKPGSQTAQNRGCCSCTRQNKFQAAELQATDQLSCAPAAGQPLKRSQSDDDGFHLNCVVAQVWLVQLRRYTEVRYEQAAGSARIPLQTGYAWRSFSTLFEPPNEIEAVRLFENLLRFANYESAAPARTFFLAYAPLAFEHDLSGEYIGPGVWSPKAGPRNAAARVRRTLHRWCDWLEALMHFQIHELHRPGLIARKLDRVIIFLWPLVCQHRWNGTDLLNVLRALERSTGFPCQSAEQLTTYCRSALGLRIPNRKTAIQKGMLPGFSVAERLFRFLSTIG